MLSKMNSRCEVYQSWKKCSNLFVNINLLGRNQVDRKEMISKRNGAEKHNGWMIDDSWEVRSSSSRSDEPPLLLLFLLFSLIFV
jgi:hypothetical protein